MYHSIDIQDKISTESIYFLNFLNVAIFIHTFINAFTLHYFTLWSILVILVHIDLLIFYLLLVNNIFCALKR